VFAERTAGESKMNLSIVVEAVLRVTLWGIGNIPRRLWRGVWPPKAASLVGDEISSV
jgi:hypothetical protein